MKHCDIQSARTIHGSTTEIGRRSIDYREVGGSCFLTKFSIQQLMAASIDFNGPKRIRQFIDKQTQPATLNN